jgi:hypothetical protein
MFRAQLSGQGAVPAAAVDPSGSFSEHSIDDQKDDSANGGNEDTPEIERLNLPETDQAAQKTTDDRPGDADKDRDKDPAWVFPGHDELGESAGNEAEKDPGENAHAHSLGLIRPAGKEFIQEFIGTPGLPASGSRLLDVLIFL